MPFFSASRLTGAGDRGFQRQVAIVARVVADRQAKVGNADMLDGLARAHDQAGRTVLQVGQAVLVGLGHGRNLRDNRGSAPDSPAPTSRPTAGSRPTISASLARSAHCCSRPGPPLLRRVSACGPVPAYGCSWQRSLSHVWSQACNIGHMPRNPKPYRRYTSEIRHRIMRLAEIQSATRAPLSSAPAPAPDRRSDRPYPPARPTAGSGPA